MVLVPCEMVSTSAVIKALSLFYYRFMFLAEGEKMGVEGQKGDADEILEYFPHV